MGEIMNYVKKMCILRQIKQGFSGDGKALSGLIKIEQYGKNIAVEVSIINFAPLVSGEYYCLLSDGKGKTEMLALRGKSLFNLLSDLDISGGFCGIICYVKNDVVPIAYGINGNGSYDWRSILNATLPPVFPNISEEKALSNADFLEKNTDLEAFSQENTKNEPTMSALSEVPPEDLPPPIPQKQSSVQTISPNQNAYNDENVATENYYEKDLIIDPMEMHIGHTKNILTRIEKRALNAKRLLESGTDSDLKRIDRISLQIYSISKKIRLFSEPTPETLTQFSAENAKKNIKRNAKRSIKQYRSEMTVARKSKGEET